MQLIRDWQSCVKPIAVVAIGNFDGVHLGHQALLCACHELANGAAIGVVSFAPLPVELLSPQHAPGRVTSTRQRIDELRMQQIDMLWLLRFNRALAQQTPQAFIQRVLVDGLAVKHVVVGDDFRFGYQRKGDVNTLVTAGKQHGFQVHVQAEVVNANQRVSSSRIRQALKKGDVSVVSEMLGRPYTISGRVIRGQQLGRKLGFPTINIDVSHWRCLLTGVFAVEVETEQPVSQISSLASKQSGEADLTENMDARQGLELAGKTTHNHSLVTHRWNGVASIGYRPSVTDTVNHHRHLLEVHLFDWCGDLYGHRVRVKFVQRLRDEQRFADLSDMTDQMQQDMSQAKRILANLCTNDVIE